MVEIPLQAIPAQEVQVALGGQNCALRVYWRFWKLFMDLFANGAPVFSGAMCQNCQWINQSPSLLFSGGLMMVDSLGDETPRWDGLGERWSLLYFDADEAADPQGAIQKALGEG